MRPRDKWLIALAAVVVVLVAIRLAHDGTVTFRAPGIRTEDALTANHVNGTLSNLTNVVESDQETFSRFGFDAQVLDAGAAKIDGSVNPLARQPTFDRNLQMRNVQLPQVNPWLRQYIKADAEQGEFELYMELAAADGRFQGYAKPLMRDVNFYSSEEPEKNPLQRIWGGPGRLRREHPRQRRDRAGRRTHSVQRHDRESQDQHLRDHRERGPQCVRQRLRARSKAAFPCAQCGAISRASARRKMSARRIRGANQTKSDALGALGTSFNSRA